MICNNCEEYSSVKRVWDALTSSPISQSFNLEDYFVLNKNDSLRCNKCGNAVSVGKHYIADYKIHELYNMIGTEVAHLVMGEIEACSSCGHGLFMRELNHSIEKTYNEKDEDLEAIFNSFDVSTTLGELIYEISNLDNDFYGYIIPKVFCPHCKSGSGENYEDKTDYGEWDEYTVVYTKAEINKFNEAFYGDEGG